MEFCGAGGGGGIGINPSKEVAPKSRDLSFPFFLSLARLRGRGRLFERMCGQVVSSNNNT